MNDPSNPRALNVNEIHEASLTRLDRVALFITNNVGSMECAALFAVLAFVSLPAALASHDTLVIVTWLSQTFAQLVLLPVILVGQNLQGRHSEARAENDFRINQLAEGEVEEILHHLDEQDAQILKIVQALEQRQEGRG